MIAGSFAGTELRYRPGRGQHALAGTNANLIALTRRHLSDLQRTPAFVLIRESGVAPLDLPAVPQLLQAERADPGPADGRPPCSIGRVTGSLRPGLS